MQKQCTIAELFQALSGKWVLPVFYHIQYENRAVRFGELRKAVGKITTSELTKSLRHLETLGLVHREQFSEIPARVEYSPTELGMSLRQPLEALTGWLTVHQSEIAAAMTKK